MMKMRGCRKRYSYISGPKPGPYETPDPHEDVPSSSKSSNQVPSPIKSVFVERTTTPYPDIGNLTPRMSAEG